MNTIDILFDCNLQDSYLFICCRSSFTFSGRSVQNIFSKTMFQRLARMHFDTNKLYFSLQHDLMNIKLIESSD